MPDIKLTNIDFEKAATDFNNAVKEAAYVVVGLGVLGFQRAQVQRVELTRQLEAQLDNLSALSATLNASSEAYATAARDQIAEAREQLARITADLPDATAVRSQLTELAKAVDEAVAPYRQQLDERFDRLEDVLPETARNLVHSAREAAAAQTRTVRQVVGLS